MSKQAVIFNLKGLSVIAYLVRIIPFALLVPIIIGIPLTVSADDSGVRVDLPAHRQLRVENVRGSVSVEVWDEKYLFVAATMEGARPGTSPVQIDNTERLLTISVAHQEGADSRRVDLKLHVPVTSQIEIVTRSGEIDVHGVPSSLTAQTTAGDIHIQVPPLSDANMTAESAHGTVLSTLDLVAPARSDEHTFQARLGAGNKIVRLHSESGRITLASPARASDTAYSPERKPPTLIGAERSGTNARTTVSPPPNGPQEIDENDIVRVDTDLVTLNISVIDRGSGRGLTGLSQKDFRIYEDRAEQQITYFESAAAPFDLLLLIDLSGSTTEVVNLVRAAALRFVATARPQDRIGVITFARTPIIVSPLTTDREALRARISAIGKPKGSTKLYDAINFAMDEIIKDSPDRRRRAIVLMSDGLDSSLPNVDGEGSTLSYEELRERVREFDGVLYSLWVDTEYEALSPHDIQPETFDLAHDRMQELAEAGGGVFYEVEKLEDLAGIYERVVADLGTVYSLSYRPSNKVRDGRWRTIHIAVPQHSNAVARGKRGYYAN